MNIFKRKSKIIEPVAHRPTVATVAVLDCGAYVSKVDGSTRDFVMTVDRSIGDDAAKAPEYVLECKCGCLHRSHCPVLDGLFNRRDGKIAQSATVRRVKSYLVNQNGGVGLVLDGEDEKDVPAIDLVIDYANGHSPFYFRTNEGVNAHKAADKPDGVADDAKE